MSLISSTCMMVFSLYYRIRYSRYDNLFSKDLAFYLCFLFYTIGVTVTAQLLTTPESIRRRLVYLIALLSTFVIAISTAFLKLEYDFLLLIYAAIALITSMPLFFEPNS